MREKYPTEKRMPWWVHISEHPRAVQLPYYDSHRCQSPELHCPFCDSINWVEPYHDRQDVECENCERLFRFEANFGYGFSSYPTYCKNNSHEFVFCSQYKHEGRLVRYLYCIDCERQMAAGPGTGIMLPWLDSYDDPNTFDPQGLLKPSAAGSDKPTPILDMLSDLRKPGSWRENEFKYALLNHQRHYEGA